MKDTNKLWQELTQDRNSPESANREDDKIATQRLAQDEERLESRYKKEQEKPQYLYQQQKESELKKTEENLNQVKGQLKSEKFKSSATEVGSVLMDGGSSALGTSKVKRLQQEIDGLVAENQELRQIIAGLNQIINKERQANEKAAEKLKSTIDKIYGWLPDT